MNLNTPSRIAQALDYTLWEMVRYVEEKIDKSVDTAKAYLRERRTKRSAN